MKTITSSTRLMQLAHAVGTAKKNKDQKGLIIAKEKLEQYKKVVLLSDEMCLGMTVGKLNSLLK